MIWPTLSPFWNTTPSCLPQNRNQSKNPTPIPGSECLWLPQLPLPYPAYLWLISTKQVQIPTSGPNTNTNTNLCLRAICQLASDDLRQHWPQPKNKRKKANQKLQLNCAEVGILEYKVWKEPELGAIYTALRVQLGDSDSGIVLSGDDELQSGIGIGIPWADFCFCFC